MRTFNQQSAIVAIELQQLVAEFAYEVDTNGSRNITQYYAEDGVFAVGDFTRKGHAEIDQFYADGAAKAKALCKDGIRIRWHTFVNFRYDITDDDNATIHFTNVHYTGEGATPVMGPISPAMVTDCRMTCRREADGLWRITLFDGTPLFVDDSDKISSSALLKS